MGQLMSAERDPGYNLADGQLVNKTYFLQSLLGKLEKNVWNVVKNKLGK
jgi:hypothetical protein